MCLNLCNVTFLYIKILVTHLLFVTGLVVDTCVVLVHLYNRIQHLLLGIAFRLHVCVKNRDEMRKKQSF